VRSDLYLAYATLAFSKGFASNVSMGLKAMLHLKLVRSRRKTLSVVIELGHPHKPCSVCCKSRGKSELFAEYSPGLWDGCVWGCDLPCGCTWTPMCWLLVMLLDRCSPCTDPHRCHNLEAVAISELSGPGWPLSSCCSCWTWVLWAGGRTGVLPGVPAEPSYLMTPCKGKGGLLLASEGTPAVPVH